MASVTFPIALGGDGTTVTDDANPLTGLRRGGYQVRFVPALTNTVNIADQVADNAQQVATNTAQVATNTAQVATNTAIANNAATTATTANLAAQLAAGVAIENYLGSLNTFTTLDTANDAFLAGDVSVGDVVLILNDSRYQGFSTINVVSESALEFDFGANEFQANGTFEFGSFFGLHQVLPPATSADDAVQGSFAFDANFFYIAVGQNDWRRITLETF